MGYLPGRRFNFFRYLVDALCPMVGRYLPAFFVWGVFRGAVPSLMALVWGKILGKQFSRDFFDVAVKLVRAPIFDSDS